MTGQVAYGDKYFPRPKDENRIWRRLDKGSHLLLLAPRRVGKTSILQNLGLTPKDGYIFLYNIVQSCGTEHEYYEQLISNIFDSEFINKVSKLKKWSTEAISNFKSSIKGVSIVDTEIKFDSTERTLTHKDLRQALYSLDIEQKLIVVVDEFPDVLEKIYAEQGRESAESFLSGCRDLWQDPKLDQKAQFIFTGSIGLDSLVHKLNLSDLINALVTTTVDPLNDEKALEFIDFISNQSNEDLEVSTDVKQYLLKKVGWNMPYYIELLWNSLEDYCCDNEICDIQNIHVDKAYDQLFTQNYKSNFNHWSERLERLDKLEKSLAHQILNYTAEHSSIEYPHIHNLKNAPDLDGVNAEFVLDSLIHDGYIFELPDGKFQFTSPMLKEWWGRYATRKL